VTLTFDLLTSGSMHAERLLYSIRVPSLMLIAQTGVLSERGQKDKQTDATKRYTVDIPKPEAIHIVYSRRE